MGEFSIWHWLIVLAIVVLVFGTKKLKNIGSDLGAAVKGFKQGMAGVDEPATPPAAEPTAPAAPQVTASSASPAAGTTHAAQAEDIAFKAK